MLDTTRNFEIPEGIDLHLQVAGPVPRALAWLIDALIRVGLYIALAILVGFLGNVGSGLLLVGVFLLEWFYPVFFEVLNNGVTPGKRSYGIRVVNDNGTPVTWRTSMLRNLLRTADFAPLFYGFGLCAMLLNRDFKRLGDMAAGTLVIYDEKATQRANLPIADPQPLPCSLEIKEQRAILDFAERSPVLSPQRCEELADIVPVITRRQHVDAVTQLYQYANWLQGSPQPVDGNVSNKP